MHPRFTALFIAAFLAAGTEGCGGKNRRAKTPAKQPVAAVAIPTDGVRCQFDAQDLATLGVKQLGAAAAVDADDALLVEADGLLYNTRTWTPLTKTALDAPLSIASDRQGIHYVISGSRFGVLTAGTFSPITALPAKGFAVSIAPNGAIHLYGSGVDGGGLIFRLRRTAEGNSVMRQLARTAEPIASLDSMGDDIVFASGNCLYRAGLVDAERSAIVLLAAMPRDVVIRAVATDLERGAIYLSTDQRTFVFAHGAILPILDLGGRLLLHGVHHDQLVVYQASSGRAFDIDLPMLSRVLVKPEPSAP